MRGCRFDPVAIVMDEKAFQRYLATGDYAPSAVPAEDMSLVEHDARWHPNGYKEGDKCLFRANLDKGDKGDVDIANATPKEGGISGIFTGSAADYAKPSLLKVGTGEGTQVYGWGLYGSTERGVAEGYARQGRNLNVAAGDAEYEMDGKSLDRKNDVIDSALTYLASERMNTQKAIEEVNRAIDGFKKQLEDTNERLEWDKNNFRLQMDAESLPRRISHLNEVKGFLERDGGKIRQVLPSENIYEQTFFTNRAPGDESHLLNWYEPVRNPIVDKVLKKLSESGKTVSTRVLNNGNLVFGVERDDGSFILRSDEFRRRPTGGVLYGLVANVLESPQAASEFLYSVGIDGIKYPVDSFGGKTIKDGDKAGWNYVSFSDDNIRVDRKWRDGEEVDDAARTKIERYLALDASPIDPEFEEKHPRGNSGNKGQFRKSEKTLAKLDEADASVRPASTAQGGGKVSPAEDAAYLAAVKNGDIATAKRMIREVAGRVIPTLLKDEDGLPLEMYHGSDQKRNVFKPFPNAYGLSGVNFIDTYGRALDYAMDKWATPENVERFAQEYPEQYEELAVEIGAESYADFADRMRDLDEDTREGIMGEVVTSAFLDIPDFTDVESIGGARVAVAQPNQIYSSEVTYDDDGNPIPLSKRFNRESNDIRY